MHTFTLEWPAILVCKLSIKWVSLWFVSPSHSLSAYFVRAHKNLSSAKSKSNQTGDTEFNTLFWLKTLLSEMGRIYMLKFLNFGHFLDGNWFYILGEVLWCTAHHFNLWLEGSHVPCYLCRQLLNQYEHHLYWLSWQEVSSYCPDIMILLNSSHLCHDHWQCIYCCLWFWYNVIIMFFPA